MFEIIDFEKYLKLCFYRKSCDTLNFHTLYFFLGFAPPFIFENHDFLRWYDLKVIQYTICVYQKLDKTQHKLDKTQ